ncbi:glycosyltransferase family A protein [Empedobacter sp. GD03797]|uniref:glycosyltransferase family 2 protein n=1 Tax=Empedobacter sp. GD03797 TaxID=2975382 RepID=UPI00244C682D|nr:glycosyltransferase family A protein [Empedobacter sp. GD03797]MDH1881984.1 glycosyltransferase family 2 protein [Empedobacter sp. GD03797]
MADSNSDEIVVSIICDCYNHEKYIAQALDGFLMQNCDFKFEVLIHDDASTDNSAAIIKEYELKYPEIIKPIYQKENQYSKKVNIWKDYQFSRAKGKYIAICEGDDYWIDPLKLQKQVDFLENNEDYSSCFTLYKRYFEKENRFEENNLPNLNDVDKTLNGQILTIENYTEDWYTQILTLLARKSIIESIDLNIYKYPRDNHFCYHLLKIDKSICFNFLTSIYRKHENGVYSSISVKNNYEQHYLIYEELYLNNLDDLKLKNFSFIMLDNLSKVSQLIDLLDFYEKIQIREGKSKLFFSYPKSQKIKFFKKLSFINKLFIVKEYCKRYVSSII